MALTYHRCDRRRPPSPGCRGSAPIRFRRRRRGDQLGKFIGHRPVACSRAGCQDQATRDAAPAVLISSGLAGAEAAKVSTGPALLPKAHGLRSVLVGANVAMTCRLAHAKHHIITAARPSFVKKKLGLPSKTCSNSSATLFFSHSTTDAVC